MDFPAEDLPNAPSFPRPIVSSLERLSYSRRPRFPAGGARSHRRALGLEFKRLAPVGFCSYGFYRLDRKSLEKPAAPARAPGCTTASRYRPPAACGPSSETANASGGQPGSACWLHTKQSQPGARCLAERPHRPHRGVCGAFGLPRV